MRSRTGVMKGAATGRVQELQGDAATSTTCAVTTFGVTIPVGDTDAKPGPTRLEAHGDTFQPG